MAQKQQANDDYDDDDDDDRRIVVRNLPQNCVKELLENYFESKKHFGEGIEVQNIVLQDDEAIITFQKPADVDQILQQHERKPCELVNTKLTICRPISDNDAIDSGSFLLVQNGSTDNTARSYGSLQTFPSLSSLVTELSCDSSDLFGSGKCIDRKSKEFLEVHLVYQQSGQDDLVLKIKETGVSPVILSYAATTCSAHEIVHATQDDVRSSVRTEQDKAPTILQNVMRNQFGDKVDITTDNLNIMVARTGQIEAVTNKEDFCKAVLATFKILENHVNVELVDLDVERLELASKHFAQVLGENKTIKMYSADDDFSFYIVYQTENEKRLVKDHIEIVSKQDIIKLEKNLPWTEIFKIEANRKKLDSQKANVRLVENCVVIEGFKEDVNSTNIDLNKIQHTTHCTPKKLDRFAADLLKETEIIIEVENMLKTTGTKVWWKVSDHFLDVVAINENQASEAANMITRFFSTHRIEMTDYLLKSVKWGSLKRQALVNNQKRLHIDDKSESPFVIIRGTRDVCNIFFTIAEDFKKENIRSIETYHMTRAKRCFALQHLNRIIETETDVEYFRLNQGNDQTELVVEATNDSRKTIASFVREISTLKLWISDEKDEEILRAISEKMRFPVAGTIHVFENQTRIILKTGRIEDEKAEVIVNSASEDLNLDSGVNTITQSIKKAAGEQAQTCLEKIKRPVRVGEVIKGDVGNMKCKALFHAILKQYDPGDITSSLEVLRKVIHVCLTKATNGGFSSIAFPALCTGVHKYPVRTVADTMFNSISEFLCQNEQSSLKEIIIVFLTGDSKKKKAFEDCKAVRVQNLADKKEKHDLNAATPWPCRYYCHITAATSNDAKRLAENVIAELKEQTCVKRLENTVQ